MPENPLLTVVMAVDDDDVSLALIQTTLEEGGFKVITASSGEEAIRTIDAEKARDLSGLVTDVQLGGELSGWDIARHARELSPSLPVVYITSDSEHEWESKGVPNSILLAKPFAPAQLVVALATLMNAVPAP